MHKVGCLDVLCTSAVFNVYPSLYERSESFILQDWVSKSFTVEAKVTVMIKCVRVGLTLALGYKVT